MTGLEHNRAALESVVGHVVTGADYYEVDYEALGGAPGPAFEAAKHHSLDFGLDILFADGRTLALFWDSQLVSYHLAVALGSVADVAPGARKWSASSIEPWTSLVGRPVARVEIFESEDAGVRYPQDVVIQVTNGPSLYVSASELRPPNQDMWFEMDHVSVAWTEEAARAWGLGPFAVDAL